MPRVCQSLSFRGTRPACPPCGCLPVRLVCVCVSKGCLQCVRVRMRRYFDAYVRACACRRVRVLVHARMRVCFQQCGYCQTV